MQENKAAVLQHILQRLHNGETAEDVKAEFKAAFESVDASEIANAERALIQSGVAVEDVQRLCNVHAAVVEGSINSKAFANTLGHPLTVFGAENDGLEHFLLGEYAEAKATYLTGGGDTAYREALAKLQRIDRHYARKENLFFPYMEKAGVTAPPKVMWGKDDEIRSLIKAVIKMTEQGLRDSELIQTMENEIHGMIAKENTILKPMLLDIIKLEEWQTIAGESAQFGYAFAEGVEGSSPSDSMAFSRGDEQKLTYEREAEVALPSGFFSLKQLRAMMDSLPCDFTFVNADNKVQYFSEGKDRVFPRTRTIIGRLVADCHPPKSLAVVEALIEAFRKGEKDEESFWIQRGEQFILIRYFAVRDEENHYLGVVEVTEEISALRKLEGSKTLMA